MRRSRPCRNAPPQRGTACCRHLHAHPPACVLALPGYARKLPIASSQPSIWPWASRSPPTRCATAAVPRVLAGESQLATRHNEAPHQAVPTVRAGRAGADASGQRRRIPRLCPRRRVAAVGMPPAHSHPRTSAPLHPRHYSVLSTFGPCRALRNRLSAAWLARARVQTRTYTCAHTHARTHLLLHAHTHANAHTQARTHTHTRTDTGSVHALRRSSIPTDGPQVGFCFGALVEAALAIAQRQRVRLTLPTGLEPIPLSQVRRPASVCAHLAAFNHTRVHAHTEARTR
jgi:hypothetical protein